MRSSTCAIFLCLAGCAGGGASVSTERQIDEMRFDRARIRDSLVETLAEAEKLRQEVSSLTTERANLQKQVADLGASLRTANSDLKVASTERDTLRSRLVESEKAFERIQTSLEKVKSVASASAGELADLRLKNQELEESVHTLQQARGSMGEENRSLGTEVESLREELTRTRAVLRSLREGTPEQESIEALEAQVQKLERQYADLQGEKVALQKRVDVLTAEKGPTGEAFPAITAVGTVYRKNPEGLIQEVTGLIQERYENAIQGEFTWDYFDFTLLGCASLLLLFLYWAGVRWLRMRRLKKQIRRLSSRVEELERSSRRASAETVETPDPVAQRNEATRSRRPAMRRSGFSAVLSNKDVKEIAVPIPQAQVRKESATEDEAEKEPVLAAPVLARPARVEKLPRPKPETRPAAVSRSWADDSVPADELANTQIMSKLDVDDRDPEPVLSLPVGGKTSRPASPAAGPEGSQGPGKTEPKKNEDAELLAELKAVINKKFDELMK
jgi:predicted nuclease with TOPRIM domain